MRTSKSAVSASKAGSALAARRIELGLVRGRAKVERPCPHCNEVFGAREMREHRYDNPVCRMCNKEFSRDRIAVHRKRCASGRKQFRSLLVNPEDRRRLGAKRHDESNVPTS